MKVLAKGQSVMRKGLLVAAFAGLFSFTASAVELKGHLTQGGLVKGHLKLTLLAPSI